MTNQNATYSTIDHFLKDAIRGLLTPILYFDTNIILDIIENRDKDSVSLYSYSWQNEWECVTSIFAKVELLEVKQIHSFKTEKRNIGWSNNRIKNELHKRDLSNRVLGGISRSITSRLKSRCEGFRQYSCLIEEGWQKAEEIKRKTNLTDKDSIHLAEAIAIACDILVTRDNFLISVAKKHLWAENPASITDILKRSGAHI